MNATWIGDFRKRVSRALRLDPTLYREVAASGGTTLQAALVILLAAVGVGSAACARVVLFPSATILANEEVAVIWEFYGRYGVPTAGLSVAAQAAAWPVWAVALWLIARYVFAQRTVPGIGAIARALAFAQAPGFFAVMVPLIFPIVLVAFRSLPADFSLLRPLAVSLYLGRSLVFGVQALLSVWVLIGTFLAVRELFGLSNARTLVATLAAGVCIAVVLAGIATVIVLSTPSSDIGFGRQGVEFLGISDFVNRQFGHRIAIGAAVPIAGGLDFNLGLIRALTWLFAEIRAF